jgi:hypothetical protein
MKTTTTKIDDAMQLMRTLKTSQVRRQLERDTEKADYFDAHTEEWISRTQIVTDFFHAAKEQL